jgi:predicted ABC-type transport system involved in lysophospholipase L1 biosynthesis ATPase subunit
MNNGTNGHDSLIQIEAMTKVFYTDEIETHALSGVHLSIHRGDYIAMSCSTRPRTAPIS